MICHTLFTILHLAEKSLRKTSKSTAYLKTMANFAGVAFYLAGYLFVQYKTYKDYAPNFDACLSDNKMNFDTGILVGKFLQLEIFVFYI